MSHIVLVVEEGEGTHHYHGNNGHNRKDDGEVVLKEGKRRERSLASPSGTGDTLCGALISRRNRGSPHFLAVPPVTHD